MTGNRGASPELRGAAVRLAGMSVATMRNNGNAWSADDDVALLTAMEQGRSMEETADLLKRSVDETRARLDALTRESGPFPRDVAAS